MKALFVTNRSLAQSLLPALKEDGVSVDVAEQASVAERKVRTEDYDAVLLDHDRVGSCAHSCLLRWRQGGLQAHVLVLLPGDCSGAEKAATLGAGADACLLRPVCVEELRAHLRAMRRRDQLTVNRPVRRVHDLEINTATRSVRRGDRTIHLTQREFELLRLLADRQGRVVTRSMIRARLYPCQEGGDSNVVDVYIRYLRKKIDKGSEKPLILTRWGQGYLLRAEDE